jgi:hypothetical protein
MNEGVTEDIIMEIIRYAINFFYARVCMQHAVRADEERR